MANPEPPTRQLSRVLSVSVEVPKLEEKFGYHAYIMYAREDDEFAGQLHEDLCTLGFNIGIHDRDFTPGESVTANIQNAMDKSRKLLFIYSPHSKASDWCQYEQTLAEHDEVDKDRIRSIFIVKDTEPEEERIKMHTYLKADGANFFEQLCEAINADDAKLVDKFPCGNIAMGLAWNYFYGYLRMILPGLPERIRKSKWFDVEPDLRRICSKMIIFVPKSCDCPDSLKDAHEQFGEAAGNLEPFTATRCGNIKRTYKSTVQVVTSKDGEKYYFVGEFPPPITTMRDMELTEMTAMDEKHKHKQVNMFYYQMINILNHSKNKSCRDKFWFFKYDDENPEKREALADRTIEFIKKTIKADLEKEEKEKEKSDNPAPLQE